MEVWDQDYVDMEVPGYIRIGSDGTGRFQFGLASGNIDGRVEQCGNAPRFVFPGPDRRKTIQSAVGVGRSLKMAS